MVARYFRTLLISFFFTMMFVSCSRNQFVPASLKNDENLNELLEIALDDSADPATRFAALEPVISRYRTAKETELLNALLGNILQNNPGDPYGVYYLMAMAEGARETGAVDLAMDYRRRLVKNYPDLEIRGQSFHLIAMGEIAGKTDNPREAIALRREMIRRYPDRIDPGLKYYALASYYNKIGDWDSMYKAYESFLSFPDSKIPGIPDARSKISAELAFHNSDKSWTMDKLDDLVNNIKYAIRTVDSGRLARYQSESFFLMNWRQETSDSFTHIPMTLGSFLKSSVRYRNELEPFSNEREAFLWTAGWTWKIPTWYLYFRRIDYPADPEINGRWEWTGIYFGERL